MSNGKRITFAVIAVAVIATVIVWIAVASGGNKTSAPAASDSTSSDKTNAPAPSSDIASTITYDGTKFSVSNEKVAAGSTVKVVNASSDKELNFDSDPHPTHTDNSQLNEGNIAPGESKTFVLTKKGTWGFHNHLDSSQHGNITVE